LYPEGEGDYATLYTYRIAGNEQAELDRFLDDPGVLRNPDYNVLVDRIWRMLDELGLYHRQSDFGASRWFRDESSFRDPEDEACALWAPIPAEDRADLVPPYPSLQLYCFRLEQMLIVDNGVVKRTLRDEDDPELTRKLRPVEIRDEAAETLPRRGRGAHRRRRLPPRW